MDKFQTAEFKLQTTLRYLRKHPGSRLLHIAELLSMCKSNVHKMLVGMESRGEIRRTDVRDYNGHRIVEWYAVATRTTPASTFKRVLGNNLPNRKKRRVSIRKPVEVAPTARLFGGL